jgi:hypothetical protein
MNGCLSLTLPDWRTALKKRIKRPRKPTWREYLYFGTACMTGFWALEHILREQVIMSGVQLGYCSCYWRLYLLEHKGAHFAAKYPYFLAILVIACFGMISLFLEPS